MTKISKGLEPLANKVLAYFTRKFISSNILSLI
jgi:hypothetical protein